MPESRIRPVAAEKKKLRRLEQVAEVRSEKERQGTPGERRWVVPVFVTVLLLGVIWIVLASIATQYIPFLAMLGQWNILIGIALIAVSFGLMTLWK